LPNGADRSPDVAWIRRDRWEALTPEQQETFPPICPDFVLELRSPTDSLKPLQVKMQEYMDNGAQLGWLLNRQDQQVFVYEAGKNEGVLSAPMTLSGNLVLPGFSLDLRRFW
jgi:Uma2 family endonuclease